MNSAELKSRTKQFALSVIKLTKYHSRNHVTDSVFRQLIRSATSVAANYRAACRAKSRADFTYKISIVLEEADESLLWLELINEGGLLKEPSIHLLIDEANQITAIFVSMLKSLKDSRNTKS